MMQKTRNLADESLDLADKAMDQRDSLRRQRDTWCKAYENLWAAYSSLKERASESKGDQPMEQAMWDRIMQSDGEVHEDGISAEAFGAVDEARKEDADYYPPKAHEDLVAVIRDCMLDAQGFTKQPFLTQCAVEYWTRRVIKETGIVKAQQNRKSLERKHIITQASYLELYEKARAYLDAAEREGEIDESRDLRDLLCDDSDIEKQIKSEGYDGS